MMYGLITGPKINVARCDEILARGAALGVRTSRANHLLAIQVAREINAAALDKSPLPAKPDERRGW
jgi:hypothetical protein